MSRTPLLAVVFAWAAGCSNLGLHPGLHPTPRPSTDSGGTSVGLVYASSSGTGADTTSLSLPYGEGWIRLGGDSGQATLRVAPGLAFFSYRIEATDAAGPVGVGIEPGLGGGYWRADTEAAVGGGDTGGGAGVIAPNLAVILFLADRSFYLAPRAGYHYYVSDSDLGDDTTGIVSLGGAIGYVIQGDPFLYSVELSVLRLTSTEEDADGSVILFSPSLGIQLAVPTAPAAPAP